MGIEIERRFRTNQWVLRALLGITPYQIAQTYRRVTIPDDKTTYRIRREAYPLGNDGIEIFLEMTKKKVGKFTFEEQDKLISHTQYGASKNWNDGIYLPIEVVKDRYMVPYDGKLWEVDVFKGPLEGLVLAEIELTDEREHVKLPSWVSKEITGDKYWGNKSLCRMINGCDFPYNREAFLKIHLPHLLENYPQ